MKAARATASVLLGAALILAGCGSDDSSITGPSGVQDGVYQVDTSLDVPGAWLKMTLEVSRKEITRVDLEYAFDIPCAAWPAKTTSVALTPPVPINGGAFGLSFQAGPISMPTMTGTFSGSTVSGSGQVKYFEPVPGCDRTLSYTYTGTKL